MKKHILTLLWLGLLISSLYFTYKYGNDLFNSIDPKLIKLTTKNMIYMFAGGFALAGLIFEIMYSNTSNSLDAYKRELEKESIDKTENSSKIKVLESKITVLEKALEEALNK